MFSVLSLLGLFILWGCGGAGDTQSSGGAATARVTIGALGGSSSSSKSVGKAFTSVGSCSGTITFTGPTTTSQTFSASTNSSTTVNVGSLSSGTYTVTMNCVDTSQTANSVTFGYQASTTVELISGSNPISLAPIFRNHITDGSTGCTYLRIAEGNSTTTSIVWGFGVALTNAQKVAFRGLAEFDSAATRTTLGALDASQTTGLKTGTKSTPYLLITGGLVSPECFLYNASDSKTMRTRGVWSTNDAGNTELTCSLGIRQMKTILDTDGNQVGQFAGLCSLTGTTPYDSLPNSSIAPYAQYDLSTQTADTDVTSLIANGSSCSTARTGETCTSGWCVGSSTCNSLSTVTLNNDVTDAAGCATGACTSGILDGSLTSAVFNGPQGLCLSPDGNALYVVDSSNNNIRKIDFTLATSSSSYVTTFAGSPTGASGSGNGACLTAATFSNPTDCVVTPDNSAIYVTDSGNNNIRKIVISGCTVSTVAGTGAGGSADGTGIAASFSSPQGIVISNDGANLYIVDTSNHTIRKMVTSSTVVSTIAGTAGTPGSANGTGTAATFDTPRFLTIDSTSSTLYITDFNNSLIRKMVIHSQAVTSLSPLLSQLVGIAIDPTDSVLYVTTTDASNQKVRKHVLATDTTSTVAGGSVPGATNGNGGSASFDTPVNIEVLHNGATLIVTESANHKLRKVQ